MDSELHKSIEELVKTNRALVEQQKFWRTFVHGIMSGLGATLGAAIILGLAVGVLQRLGSIQFFKPAVEQVLPYVQKKTTSPAVIKYLSPSPDIQPTPSPTPSPSETP